VEIQGMGCRRLRIHLDRSIDTASRRLKAQRDPATAGEEIKKPGRCAARQTGQLSLNGRLSARAAGRSARLPAAGRQGPHVHGRRVENILEWQRSKVPTTDGMNGLAARGPRQRPTTQSMSSIRIAMCTPVTECAGNARPCPPVVQRLQRGVSRLQASRAVNLASTPAGSSTT
jgi:hypothetical protein